jgi:hypothetical protein
MVNEPMECSFSRITIILLWGVCIIVFRGQRATASAYLSGTTGVFRPGVQFVVRGDMNGSCLKREQYLNPQSSAGLHACYAAAASSAALVPDQGTVPRQ